jgi:hypothetical protein
MSIQTLKNNSVRTDCYRSETSLSDSSYVVLSDKNRTVSKSFQSKAKNLLYTLSKPFRALIRLELQQRVAQKEETRGLISIKSTPIPRITTHDRRTEFVSQSNRGYVIVSESEGHGKPSLFDRLWG